MNDVSLSDVYFNGPPKIISIFSFWIANLRELSYLKQRSFISEIIHEVSAG